MSIELSKIQGIGPKLRERILDYFGHDEKNAIKALKNCMGGVINGISQRQAIKFARQVFNLENKADLHTTLKTDAIIDIYNDIIDLISEYFITEYSRNKISLYFPLGPENIDLIRERYDYFDRALKFVNKHGTQVKKLGLNDHLTNLGLLKSKTSIKKNKNRCILTDLKSVKNQLVDMNITTKVSTELVNFSTVQNVDKFFKEYSNTFQTIIVITKDFSSIPDAMNVILLHPDEISEVTLTPETIIDEFSENSQVIDAIYGIASILKNIEDEDLLKDFLPHLDIDKIVELQENSEILDDNGDVQFGFDRNLDLYKEDAKKFSGILVEIENWINDKIKDEINASQITIEGEKILDLFRNDVSIDRFRQYVPVEVEELIEETIDEGIVKLEELLHISPDQRDWLSELKPEIIEIPVSLNYEGTNQLEFNVDKRAAVYSYQIGRDIARKLDQHKSYLSELIWTMLEFEFFYSIGQFAVDYKLNIPKIVPGEHGIAIEDSFNLELMNQTIKSGIDTVPINYCVGSLRVDGGAKSRLNLLSGSNSGGKTMCLYTIAHSLILAQMGLPAPGKVRYFPVSEVYFFKKSSGQLSAGAFERTLLMFVDLAQSPKEKILLADELEAITEPNAAARVISAIFSLLLENPNNYAIFVTHLIELLVGNLTEAEKEQIRFDGIEAQGLNKELELIVDRSPKFDYIAKSTPELILERLSKKGKREQKQFFSRILENFQDD